MQFGHGLKGRVAPELAAWLTLFDSDMVTGLAVRGRRQCEAKIVDQRGGLIGRWILIG